jgi:hypothetical protein
MSDNIIHPYSAIRLECPKCHAETNAPCNCGVAYVPKSIKAQEAVAAHPEKSNRAIAAEVGVDEKTVRKAREATADKSAVETRRTGMDGVTRKLPERKAEPEPEDTDDVEPKATEAERKKSFLAAPYYMAEQIIRLQKTEVKHDAEVRVAARLLVGECQTLAGERQTFKEMCIEMLATMTSDEIDEARKDFAYLAKRAAERRQAEDAAADTRQLKMPL